MEFVNFDIYYSGYIQTHCQKKNKKIKLADQILPEVYGTTLRTSYLLWLNKAQPIGTITNKLKIQEHLFVKSEMYDWIIPQERPLLYHSHFFIAARVAL